MLLLKRLPPPVRQYLLITANYWSFTLTDGALRMLVVLHFHALGYPPLQIAFLFLFYEFFGVVTNLCGGWLGARLGLNKTMNTGLFLQIVALGMLLVPVSWLSVGWVMIAQAISGIAKDLNKMSAKSAIKLLIPKDAQGALYKWVAFLTGSKNALKGFGFFLGGLLLSLQGFTGAILTMLMALILVWVVSLLRLKKDLGKTKSKPKFSQLFSKSRQINQLSAARLFLFGARDIWFVVALPVYLATEMGWSHWAVGGFLAAWVIAYGVVQGVAPRITGSGDGLNPAKSTVAWGSLLGAVLLILVLSMQMLNPQNAQAMLIIGLLSFGFVFAINSSLHSFLVVQFASAEGVSLDVGFYYMANAGGRLVGTVLSGLLFQQWGIVSCLSASAVFVLLTVVISVGLPKTLREKSTALERTVV